MKISNTWLSIIVVLSLIAFITLVQCSIKVIEAPPKPETLKDKIEVCNDLYEDMLSICTYRTNSDYDLTCIKVAELKMNDCMSKISQMETK